MEYLHKALTASAGAVVEVTLDRQANVQLLDPSNYAKFQRGQAYRYQGGLATQSPVHLRVPHTGTWHIVIDRGSAGGQIGYSIRVIS